jgi:hypothetical protein
MSDLTDRIRPLGRSVADTYHRETATTELAFFEGVLHQAWLIEDLAEYHTVPHITHEWRRVASYPRRNADLYAEAAAAALAEVAS